MILNKCLNSRLRNRFNSLLRPKQFDFWVNMLSFIFRKKRKRSGDDEVRFISYDSYQYFLMKTWISKQSYLLCISHVDYRMNILVNSCDSTQVLITLCLISNEIENDSDIDIILLTKYCSVLKWYKIYISRVTRQNFTSSHLNMLTVTNLVIRHIFTSTDIPQQTQMPPHLRIRPPL